MTLNHLVEHFFVRGHKKLIHLYYCICMAEIKFSSVKKKKLSIDDSLYLFFPCSRNNQSIKFYHRNCYLKLCSPTSTPDHSFLAQMWLCGTAREIEWMTESLKTILTLTRTEISPNFFDLIFIAVSLPTLAT